MSKKPNRQTAMSNIINLVREDFPFYAPESQICGDTCVGCPKKLLELAETEVIYPCYLEMLCQAKPRIPEQGAT